MAETLYKLNSLRLDCPFQAKVCAAVVRKNRIVDVGFNSKKTHTMQKGFNEMKPYLHAEIEAMLRAHRKLENLDGCFLVVVRTKKNGRGGTNVGGCSKPCDSCQRGMKNFGIKKAYYVDENGDICLLNLK